MTAQRSDTVGEGWGESRSRVVTWHGPGPSTARGLTMAGLDYLRAMIDGTLPLPPICQLMRFDIVAAEPGRVVFTCEPDESAYKGSGSFMAVLSAPCWTPWPPLHYIACCPKAAAAPQWRSR